MATTTNHSFLLDSRASGSSTQRVLRQLINDLDAQLSESGQATFSGDGAQTTFQIAHGLAYTPSKAQITARSADAAGDLYVSGTDGTNITVEYASAPASGTDNVVLDWAAYP